MKKLVKSLLVILLLSNTTCFGQAFKVKLLIDKVYSEATLNTFLETMGISTLIEEDYLKIQMISVAEVESKVRHSNGLDGKEAKKCEVVLDAGVRCNPCARLMKAKGAKDGTVKLYAQTMDNDLGNCNLGVDDYEALGKSDNLEDIIKAEKKKAKKAKGDYTVVIWIPSAEAVSIDLTVSTTDKKVDFGTELTFTAKTNSKENTKIIMAINDEVIDECKEAEGGALPINRSTPFSKVVEIIEPTKVTVKGKGCGEVQKEIIIELSGNCNSNNVENVSHQITYDSKSFGPLGIKREKTLDGIPCTEIRLVDNKYYMVVINKQCAFKNYRVELQKLNSGVEFKIPMKKSVDQSSVHLKGSDKDDYIIYTLNHDDMKSKGVFDRSPDEDEPKYKMRIVPTEAIKDDIDTDGYESEWKTVKFQKCN